MKTFDTFAMTMRFTVAVKSMADADVSAAIGRWCQRAEAFYDTKPALKIQRTITHNDKAADTTLDFASQAELNKYMEREFDNIVGNRKTEGCMQVLVVDSIRVGGKDGTVASSFYPQWMQPFRRKHGILISASAPDFVLAHELGHVFSLKHSFESYIGLTGNCNKDFVKEPGGSRKGSTINLMDYMHKAGDTITLNSCQRDRAADQRRQWLTGEGLVNYRQLRGL